MYLSPTTRDHNCRNINPHSLDLVLPQPQHPSLWPSNQQDASCVLPAVSYRATVQKHSLAKSRAWARHTCRLEFWLCAFSASPLYWSLSWYSEMSSRSHFWAFFFKSRFSLSYTDRIRRVPPDWNVAVCLLADGLGHLIHLFLERAENFVTLWEGFLDPAVNSQEGGVQLTQFYLPAGYNSDGRHLVGIWNWLTWNVSNFSL